MRFAKYIVAVASLATSILAAQNGEAVYKKACAGCHDAGVGRAPNRAALLRMSPENIRFALVSGKMLTQAFTLTSAEIGSVIEYVTGKALSGQTFPKEAFCPAGGAAFEAPFAKPYWNGWGVGPAQHRFQPASMAQLSVDQVPKLKLKWAFGFPGDTRATAQPTVAGGRSSWAARREGSTPSIGYSTPISRCVRLSASARWMADGRPISAISTRAPMQ
jgi:polyvinyl alcohol dehydrogenase (cytochrome)